MLFSYNNIQQLIPVILEGIVLDKKTGRPLPGAHVYVVPGEEAFTGADGEFMLKSWQPVPLTIIVEHTDYAAITVKITALSQKQVVYMT
jgi:hypothetical protein